MDEIVKKMEEFDSETRKVYKEVIYKLIDDKRFFRSVWENLEEEKAEEPLIKKWKKHKRMNSK